MARDIPGYYFGRSNPRYHRIPSGLSLILTVAPDPAKGKYFRIQPNHAVPSAAKHSKQAVDAQLLSTKKRKLEGELQRRHLRERVQRSRLLEHPLMNRRRIRNAVGGVHGCRASVLTEVAAYYGASLSRTTVTEYDYPRVRVPKFAIDDVTADLIATSTGPNNIVFHHIHSPKRPSGPYPHETYVAISAVTNPVTALLITTRPFSCILWATSASASATGTVRVVSFGREQERAEAMRLQRPAGPGLPLVNYDDMGVSWSVPESDIWDMAASASGRTVVAGCSTGLCIFGDLDHRLDNLMRKSNDREYMAVAFKDENVVFGGTRAGVVGMLDLRSLAGTARLKHGSGVTAVRALSDDNYVVVRGLEKMSIYDLRYTPQSNSLSKPYTTFPGSYASDRFGLGFDYDPALGLIATAHSSSSLPSSAAAATPRQVTGNRLSLFSTRTGKMVPSPINSYSFPAPVTCVQFTNAIRSRSAGLAGGAVADDGRPRENNEPKSIVIASGGQIDEWSVQGLGYEDRRQE